MLVAISLVLIFAGIALPMLQQAKEESRRIVCSNRIRSLINGSILYEEANEKMPPLTTGPGVVATATDLSVASHQNTGAMSYVLPFINQHELFDLLPPIATNFYVELNTPKFPNISNFLADPGMATAIRMKPDFLICPSNASYSDAFVEDLYFFLSQRLDFFTILPFNFNIQSTEFGRTSYVPSMGGFTLDRISASRGIDLNLNQVLGAMRNRGESIPARDLLDGASNTIAWGESVGWIQPAECGAPPRLTGANMSILNPAVVTGDRWNLDFENGGTLFGSPTASLPFIIGSNHPEGANVAMYDASVRLLNRNTSRQVAAALGCGGDGWIPPETNHILFNIFRT